MWMIEPHCEFETNWLSKNVLQLLHGLINAHIVPFYLIAWVNKCTNSAVSPPRMIRTFFQVSNRYSMILMMN